jgi:hypothetical protein
LCDLRRRRLKNEQAWVSAGSREIVSIVTNGVDAELTEFLALLVDRYRSWHST